MHVAVLGPEVDDVGLLWCTDGAVLSPIGLHLVEVCDPTVGGERVRAVGSELVRAAEREGRHLRQLGVDGLGAAAAVGFELAGRGRVGAALVRDRVVEAVVGPQGENARRAVFADFDAVLLGGAVGNAGHVGPVLVVEVGQL